MFWALSQPSKINELLEKEATLERILDEEDVLQECKGQNKKLLDFFTEPARIDELLHYALDEPPDNLNEQVRYKYPNLACEILTAETDDIPNSLIFDGPKEQLEQLSDTTFFESRSLQTLYSFLYRPAPLNPLTASFFMKIMRGLFGRRTRRMLTYLKAKPDFLSLVTSRFETSAMAELVLSLLREVDDFQLRRDIHQWLHSAGLCEKLFALFTPESSDDTLRYAVYCLCELILNLRNNVAAYEEETKQPADEEYYCLLSDLESVESLSALLQRATASNTTRTLIEVTCEYLQALLDRDKITNPMLDLGVTSNTKLNPDRIKVAKQHVIQAVLPHANALFDLVRRPTQQTTIMTTIGGALPPFGISRVWLLQLLESLLLVNDHTFNVKVKECGLIRVLLKLVVEYPWNSFMHQSVMEIVTAILTAHYFEEEATVSIPSPSKANGSTAMEVCPSNDASTTDTGNSSSMEVHSTASTDSSFMLHHLLVECELVHNLLLYVSVDRAAREQKSPRRGYMGHVIRMVNVLKDNVHAGVNAKLLQQHWTEVDEVTRLEWEHFVAEELEKINSRNQIDLPFAQTEARSNMDDDFADIIDVKGHTSAFEEWKLPDNHSADAFFSFSTTSKRLSLGLSDEEEDETVGDMKSFTAGGGHMFTADAKADHTSGPNKFRACFDDAPGETSKVEPDDADIWDEKNISLSDAFCVNGGHFGGSAPKNKTIASSSEDEDEDDDTIESGNDMQAKAMILNFQRRSEASAAAGGPESGTSNVMSHEFDDEEDDEEDDEWVNAAPTIIKQKPNPSAVTNAFADFSNVFSTPSNVEVGDWADFSSVFSPSHPDSSEIASKDKYRAPDVDAAFQSTAEISAGDENAGWANFGEQSMGDTLPLTISESHNVSIDSSPVSPNEMEHTATSAE